MENKFKYSSSNKRYHTYDYYLRTCLMGKCAKIPLDCGFTCPNIDGKVGTKGCIYCSKTGLSKPYFASSCAVTAGLGAFSLKKGPPGIAFITKNVIVMTRNTVNKASRTRFTI